MSLKDRYEKRKEKLLDDKKINEANRKLFKKFFDYEEKKLKRENDLRVLDEKCYKTLILYEHYFRQSNKWFKNKDWKKLTKKDIEKVYDDLEDGVIKKTNGEPYEDRVSYYNKVFKSKPFALAKKKDIAQEIILYTKPKKNNEVDYIEHDDVKKILMAVTNPLRFWLSYDSTENLGAILELQKRNFVKQINQDTKEVEYLINLPQDKIKRSRTTRSILTNFKETTELLDIALEGLKDEDYLFNSGLRQAEKDFKKAVLKTEVKSKPNGKIPTPKDLISSAVCFLLDRGWSIDEIKARKGHKPSSSAIDKYCNYKALSSTKPKIKIYQSNLGKIETELEESKGREKLKNVKFDNLQNEFEEMKERLNRYEEKIKANENNRENDYQEFLKIYNQFKKDKKDVEIKF